MPLQYAIAGVATSGNSASGYVTAKQAAYSTGLVIFTINGTDRSRFVSRYESEILDQQNEVPNTATLVVRGFTPTVGQTVTITRQLDNSKLFEGQIVRLEQVQRRNGTRVRYRLHCIDWTFLLDRRLVTKFYASQSATTTAKDMMVSFASGFTYANVEPSLTSVEFPNKMETVSRSLTRLANLVGAFWYVDYDKDLHFRTTENLVNPTSLTTTNTGADRFKRLKYWKDLAQIRTRVYVEGMGTSVVVAVGVGASAITVVDHAMFSTAGGLATTGHQLIAYTGKSYGDPVYAVWTPRTPASAVTWTDVVWADTLALFVAVGASAVMTSPDGILWTSRTPAESITYLAMAWASSIGTLCAVAGTGTNRVMTSSDGITWTARVAADVTQNWADVVWAPSLSRFAAVNGGGVAANQVMTSSDGISWTIRTASVAQNWSAITWAPSLSLYCAVAASVGTNTVMTSPDGITWTTRTASVSALWADIDWSPSLSLFVAVSATSAMSSPDGTTWTTRTLPASAQTILWSAELALFIVPENTGSGSAGFKRIMTSSDGITWTLGTIPDHINSGVAWSSTLGRLVGVGNTTGTNVVISGGYNAISGIAATGDRSVRYAINAGDDLNLVAQRDDTTAQTALAALEGGDGIHEHYIQDRRLSLTGANARGDAELTLGKDPDELVTFTSEDWNAQSGRSVTVNVASISVTVKIQQVRIYWMPGRWTPQRDVTATNRFKSFFQYVRDLEDKAAKIIT